MTTVTVALSSGSYPIHIAAGLLADADLWSRLLAGRQAFVLSDDNVAARWLPRLQQGLAGADAPTLILPPGEEQKSLGQFAAVIDALVQHKRRRNSVLIALGGGVIGDLGGFAAACYQRGIACIQVPTTLLAMVDSSVGGKTAINHPASKNLIGAFHQPEAVIADLATLATLPQREFRSGLAEIIKYGLIADADFLLWLEQQLDALLAHDAEALAHAIARSCAHKAAIVARDPTEQGERALLNLGHTFAHAIETELGYGAWLHGEAVAAGLVLAAELAAELGTLPDRTLAQRTRHWLQRAALPVGLPAGIDHEALLRHMALDKKNLGSTLRFILPTAVGRSAIVDGIETGPVRRVLGR
ncbi:3-dehydroquinate synthase [Permianibacter sp. IMCC34836]|uniref:3-dehydroquinate synthase n=1 Tax=Permianibacter fluminis TaxID=2738515 RepID=UPI001557D4FD|nr:3-dehydroquinate synthase [Permianibacter fluminis]NQD36297.1 3-dehydroquinate synthase [Permianibacter fluminis]